MRARTKSRYTYRARVDGDVGWVMFERRADAFDYVLRYGQRGYAVQSVEGAQWKTIREERF